MSIQNRLIVLALAVVVGACFVYHSPTPVELKRPAAGDSLVVKTPVRAHLVNGETVFFPRRMVARQGRLFADGDTMVRRYSLTLKDLGAVNSIPLDSVLGLETVQDRMNVGATLVLTPIALAGEALGVATVVVAISCINNPKCFGSCPTVYADSAGTPVLQAEGFSYSIAPIFEAPDLDRLRVHPDSTGAVRLEVRNEAYETHYINQLNLVEVRHDAGELVLPDDANQPVAVAGLTAPTSARDRSGQDVGALLNDADGRVYHTPPSVLSAATARDPDDHIDLTFAKPVGRDTAALVFRMRNSLLNTVILYELMLGDPGLRSLDWIGQDLSNIGPAARLGRWYAGHMGLRVAVWDGQRFQDVARIADTGPVAWKDVALRIPVHRTDSVRVRLSFVADDWRIDMVRLAQDVRTPESRLLAPVSLTTGGGGLDTAALARVVAPDTTYLVTMPGQRFFLRFEAGASEPPAGRARTFLLQSQGYYIEWLRGDWLRTEHLASTFEPSDEALETALRRWQAEQADLEARFYATRVPVK